MAEQQQTAADAARRAWLKRVLTVDVRPASPDGGAEPTPTRDFATARQMWTSAIETVNGQIGSLQTMLRESGDEDLKAIAEYGLSGVTGNHRAKLMAALHEVGGGARGAAATKAVGLITSFRQHLASDERVAAVERNPFGVVVAIRATLDPALHALAASITDMGTPPSR